MCCSSSLRLVYRLSISRIILSILITSLLGCSSIGLTFSDDATQHGKYFYVGGQSSYCVTYHGEFYAGVKEDAAAINNCFKEQGGLLWEVSCWLIFMPIIDLPFSLVADTIFIPYVAIHNEKHRGVYRDDKGNICPLENMRL